MAPKCRLPLATATPNPSPDHRAWSAALAASTAALAAAWRAARLAAAVEAAASQGRPSRAPHLVPGPNKRCGSCRGSATAAAGTRALPGRPPLRLTRRTGAVRPTGSLAGRNPSLRRWLAKVPPLTALATARNATGLTRLHWQTRPVDLVRGCRRRMLLADLACCYPAIACSAPRLPCWPHKRKPIDGATIQPGRRFHLRRRRQRVGPRSPRSPRQTGWQACRPPASRSG